VDKNATVIIPTGIARFSRKIVCTPLHQACIVRIVIST
jgi:hypothetical protein